MGTPMIYIDSSSLLKVVHPEPETLAVIRAISRESEVVVSALADLETLVQLKALYKAGHFGITEWRKFEAQLYLLRNQPPYHYSGVPSAVWNTALRQHRNSGEIHCRTLDRLHLAVMERLDLTRLMTNDSSQAAAARQLGFEVIQPGR
jgi:predicted nucleic acid-binding protein